MADSSTKKTVGTSFPSQNNSQVNDGTVNLENMPLCGGQIWVLIVASMGQFIGQGLATLVGIIIPMIELMAHPELPAIVQGVLGCVALCGRTLGTVLFGRMSDRWGYLTVARVCPLLMIVASLIAYFWHPVGLLCICLFVMGLSVGGEYSIDSDYISEIMPKKWKFFMVGAAKASASVGSVVVAALCYFIIRGWTIAASWPNLLFIMTGIAGVILLMRIHFAESPGWLMSHGRTRDAEKAVHYLLGKDVYMPVPPQQAATEGQPSDSMWTFMRKNVRKILFTGVPWACEGLGVYGIGIFIPILIMSLGIDYVSPTAPRMAHIVNSVEITILLSVFMTVGFGMGLAVVRRYYHVSMQTYGFIGSAAGLGVMLAAYQLHWPAWISITGFVLFELFLNAGPHLITFILPSQVYPVIDRGSGVGLSAAIGKFGAVLGAFFIPVMLKHWGCGAVIAVSVVVMLLGALVTGILGPKVLPESHIDDDVTDVARHS